MNIITPSLEAAGLTTQQATLYELLLGRGRERASRLVRETPWKRGVVYKILAELVGLGLVEEKKTPGSVTIFLPRHPLALKDLAERREREARDRTLSLESALPSLVSEFNLQVGTPGVMVYEGEAGIQKALDDTLLVRDTVIDTFVDIEAIERYIPEINERYVKKREQLGIDKRGIVFDTPAAREQLKNYHRLSTDVRFLTLPKGHSFGSIFQIYADKVLYITLSDERFLGIIIQNKTIHDMHKTIFDFVWQNAKTE